MIISDGQPHLINSLVTALIAGLGKIPARTKTAGGCGFRLIEKKMDPFDEGERFYQVECSSETDGT